MLEDLVHYKMSNVASLNAIFQNNQSKNCLGFVPLK